MHTTELCAATDGQLSMFLKEASKMCVHTQQTGLLLREHVCICITTDLQQTYRGGHQVAVTSRR